MNNGDVVLIDLLFNQLIGLSESIANMVDLTLTDQIVEGNLTLFDAIIAHIPLKGGLSMPEVSPSKFAFGH